MFKIKWKKKIYILSLLFLGLFFIAIFNLQNNKRMQLFQSKSSQLSNVSIYSLTNSLEPDHIYKNIQCRKSKLIYVQTTLCVHDLEKDIFVSKSIWLNGVWEQDILQYFLKSISHDHLVFDIGAQIGQYSLFAAKMGYKVIAVEPFYENLIRIHKACILENIQNKIILVNNALSNNRGKIKKLNQNKVNIGGQNLIENQNEFNDYSQVQNNKYFVKTICMDDLITIFPLKIDGTMYMKGIIKLDIEGHESLIFECASMFFKKIDIEIILMEWMNIASQTNIEKIENTIKFLLKRDFLPYDRVSELRISDWRSWPKDIIWKKIKL